MADFEDPERSGPHPLPEGCHTVELVFADGYGVLRGKRVPAGRWPAVARKGVAVSSAALVWAVRCELRDETPAGGMEQGFPDMQVVPRDEAPRAVPWKPGVAQVLCDILTAEGEPHPLCPRNALVRAVDAVAEAGYTAKVALEMEFYLLSPDTLAPLASGVNCYAVADQFGYAPVLQDVQNHAVALGVPVEAWNYEYSPGQFEVNLVYDDVLAAADDAIRLRNLVKEVALQHGLLATFMGKPFTEESGSGMHVHQSLWQGGRNAFAAEDGSDDLSDLGRHYLGGLQEHMRDLTLLGSPTLNDYKRRQDGSFCPTRATWGDDNRTVAIRVVRAGSTRIEQRDGSASANPYALVAGQLAAGLDGVLHKTEPPAKCEGNSYEALDVPLLPRTVLEAATLLEGSALARRAFGDLFVDTTVDTARAEHALLADPVSDAERQRYIGTI